MGAKTLLGIRVPVSSKKDILDKIKKNISSRGGFCHIVSINPENLVIANENDTFKKIIRTAQIAIIDGMGIVLAARMLNIEVGARLTGVDMMGELARLAYSMRLRVMLIGGKHNLAEYLADCYNTKYPEAKFLGVTGIEDIKNPKPDEEKAIFSIVADFRPQIVIVSFGSPYQEIWLERHKNKFRNMTVAGVGGAFDFVGGRVLRAPGFIRKIGGEWLFRLIAQPWRWRRQLRLLTFIKLVFYQKWRKV